jgi:hypothetical protein
MCCSSCFRTVAFNTSLLIGKLRKINVQGNPRSRWLTATQGKLAMHIWAERCDRKIQDILLSRTKWRQLWKAVSPSAMPITAAVLGICHCAIILCGHCCCRNGTTEGSTIVCLGARCAFLARNLSRDACSFIACATRQIVTFCIPTCSQRPRIGGGGFLESEGKKRSARKVRPVFVVRTVGCAPLMKGRLGHPFHNSVRGDRNQTEQVLSSAISGGPAYRNQSGMRNSDGTSLQGYSGNPVAAQRL